MMRCAVEFSEDVTLQTFIFQMKETSTLNEINGAYIFRKSYFLYGTGTELLHISFIKY
jgi:hypothetical protein